MTDYNRMAYTKARRMDTLLAALEKKRLDGKRSAFNSLQSHQEAKDSEPVEVDVWLKRRGYS